MENASKALIIAGGVLISIVIISMFMLMINSLTSYQQTDLDVQRNSQVVTFNQQFEGYNREGVRGNELYSLINKTMDYNQRKSFMVPGTDEYEPMTITIDLDGKQGSLTRTDTNEIYKESKYTYSDTTSSRNYKGVQVMQEIENLKTTDISSCSNNNEYSKKRYTLTDEQLERFVIEYDRIFTSEFNKYSKDEKRQVFYNVNSVLAVDGFIMVDKINDSQLNSFYSKIYGTLKPLVDKYYEYVQFKRGMFKCTHVDYSNLTGRIIQMDFVFTGEFN